MRLLILAVLLAGCASPPPQVVRPGAQPQAAWAPAPLSQESFERIQLGRPLAEAEAVLGKSKPNPSPNAFYGTASAAEVASEFGVKSWAEWWDSSSGATIYAGLDSRARIVVKQWEDGVGGVAFLALAKDGTTVRRVSGR